MGDRSLTRNGIAVLAVCFILSLLVYSRAFDNGFRQDDFIFLKHAETAPLLDSLKPSSEFSFYRPASLVLFRLEHALFGRNGGAYIAANFVFHCLTALIALLVLRTIGLVPGSESTAAGLFLLGLFHYGKTVMWACSSGLIVSTALSLTGLFVVLRRAGCGAEDGGAGTAGVRAGRLLLAAAIISLAMLFHEAAIVTPAVAFLAVLACRGDGRLRGAGKAALLLIPIPAFLAVYRFLGGSYTAYQLDSLPIGRVPEYLVRYAGFAVVPIQRTGIIDAPLILRRLIEIAPQLQMAAGVMVLVALGFLAATGKRGLTVLGAWAPAAILPYTLIALPENWLQLRYLYHAAIPLCGLAAAGWHRLAFSEKAALRAVAAVLLVLAVLCTSTLAVLLERHYAAFPGA